MTQTSRVYLIALLISLWAMFPVGGASARPAARGLPALVAELQNIKGVSDVRYGLRQR